MTIMMKKGTRPDAISLFHPTHAFTRPNTTSPPHIDRSTPATAAPPTVALHAAAASATSSPVDFLGGLFAGAAAGGKKEYTVVITGASGMIGQALTKALAASTVGGKPVKVVPVSRSSGATSWDPSSGAINAQALEGVDAVVHLAGACVPLRVLVGLDYARVCPLSLFD